MKGEYELGWIAHSMVRGLPKGASPELRHGRCLSRVPFYGSAQVAGQ
jgi:hypothetical protein